MKQGYPEVMCVMCGRMIKEGDDNRLFVDGYQYHPECAEKRIRFVSE